MALKLRWRLNYSDYGIDWPGVHEIAGDSRAVAKGLVSQVLAGPTFQH